MTMNMPTTTTDLTTLTYEELRTERRHALDAVGVLDRLAKAGRAIPPNWQWAANGAAATQAAACLVEMRRRRPADPQTAKNIAASREAADAGRAAAEAQDPFAGNGDTPGNGDPS